MMHVPENTCAAVRFQLEGMAHGRPVVVTEHVNRLRPDIAELDNAAEAIRAAAKPLLIAGGGVHYAGAAETLLAGHVVAEPE